MLDLRRADPSFTDEVLSEPGGENLLKCYACGTCMSTCLVKRYNPEFNPRRLIRRAALGLREQALADPTYWLCSACDACYARCPQSIHISDVMRAIRNVAMRGGAESPLAAAKVDTERCSGCTACMRACPYDAITMVAKEENGLLHQVSYVNPSLCLACGVCTATCPSLAITLEGYSQEQMLAQLGAGGWLEASYDAPKIAAFVCNWCLRAEEDLAALDRLPPNVRVVRVPCSGRVDPLFVLHALREPVGGVLVAGCTPGECHYKEGNSIEQSRLLLLQMMMGHLGMDARRVRFARFGAADRGQFERTLAEMMGELAAVAPEGWSTW